MLGVKAPPPPYSQINFRVSRLFLSNTDGCFELMMNSLCHRSQWKPGVRTPLWFPTPGQRPPSHRSNSYKQNHFLILEPAEARTAPEQRNKPEEPRAAVKTSGSPPRPGVSGVQDTDLRGTQPVSRVSIQPAHWNHVCGLLGVTRLTSGDVISS